MFYKKTTISSKSIDGMGSNRASAEYDMNNIIRMKMDHNVTTGDKDIKQQLEFLKTDIDSSDQKDILKIYFLIEI